MLPEQVAALRELAELYPGVRIILLGATALGLHIDMTWRGTRDLDVSLSLPVADLSRLDTLQGWARSGVEHRWVAPAGVLVDIVPVDNEALRKGVLRWPRSGNEMSVVGFRAAFAAATDRDLGGVVVGLPPPAAIAMLKMVAYMDRPPEREKDLGDLAHLIDLHLPEFDPRRWEEEVQEHNLEYHETGPFLLGRDLAAIVDESERSCVVTFLSMLENDEAPHYPASRLLSRAPRSWGEAEEREAALRERLRALHRGFAPVATVKDGFDAIEGHRHTLLELIADSALGDSSTVTWDMKAAAHFCSYLAKILHTLRHDHREILDTPLRTDRTPQGDPDHSLNDCLQLLDERRKDLLADIAHAVSRSSASIMWQSRYAAGWCALVFDLINTVWADHSDVPDAPLRKKP